MPDGRIFVDFFRGACPPGRGALPDSGRAGRPRCGAPWRAATDFSRGKPEIPWNFDLERRHAWRLYGAFWWRRDAPPPNPIQSREKSPGRAPGCPLHSACGCGFRPCGGRGLLVGTRSPRPPAGKSASAAPHTASHPSRGNQESSPCDPCPVGFAWVKTGARACLL